jgi:hypothetical protein
MAMSTTNHTSSAFLVWRERSHETAITRVDEIGETALIHQELLRANIRDAERALAYMQTMERVHDPSLEGLPVIRHAVESIMKRCKIALGQEKNDVALSDCGNDD